MILWSGRGTIRHVCCHAVGSSPWGRRSDFGRLNVFPGRLQIIGLQPLQPMTVWALPLPAARVIELTDLAPEPWVGSEWL
jgi:hypothetical protein